MNNLDHRLNEDETHARLVALREQRIAEQCCTVCGAPLIEDQQYPEMHGGYWSCPEYMDGNDQHDSVFLTA